MCVCVSVCVCVCVCVCVWERRGANVSIALVFMPGSPGLNFLYSSTSFSIDRTSACNLLRRAGNVSRI